MQKLLIMVITHIFHVIWIFISKPEVLFYMKKYELGVTQKHYPHSAIEAQGSVRTNQ